MALFGYRLARPIKTRKPIALILASGMAVVILAVITVATMLDIRQERNFFLQELERRGRLLAETLNDTLADSLYFLDVDKATDVTSAVEMSQVDLPYIKIFRPDGSLLANTKSQDESGGRLSTWMVHTVIRNQEPVLEFRREALEVTSPIIAGNQLVGIVQFDLSSASLSAHLSDIIWEQVRQGLALLVVAVLLAFGIARFVTKPLQALRTAATHIGNGELEYQVPIGGPEETADLGQALDGMRLQLKGLYQNLERQVAERTKELLGANETLKEEIAQRIQAENIIKISLQEKEVLLKEINHRVKNNLQIISSLLNLQSRDIQDEQALHAFRVSQDRIKSMALVHEKLYQSEDMARINFGEYIKYLAAELAGSYGLVSRDIDLKINVENILLSVDTAIPCGIIVNELVANSLKHAFPGDRTGEIAVNFWEADGQYSMVFKDDGVGLPEDLDISRPSSLGMSIVNALIGQLGGTISSGRNGGCEITVTFPAKQPQGV